MRRLAFLIVILAFSPFHAHAQTTDPNLAVIDTCYAQMCKNLNAVVKKEKISAARKNENIDFNSCLNTCMPEVATGTLTQARNAECESLNYAYSMERGAQAAGDPEGTGLMLNSFALSFANFDYKLGGLVDTGQISLDTKATQIQELEANFQAEAEGQKAPYPKVPY